MYYNFIFYNNNNKKNLTTFFLFLNRDLSRTILKQDVHWVSNSKDKHMSRT